MKERVIEVLQKQADAMKFCWDNGFNALYAEGKEQMRHYMRFAEELLGEKLILTNDWVVKTLELPEEDD